MSDLLITLAFVCMLVVSLGLLRELDRTRGERRELWQRIQAPEHAVVAHYNEQQTFDSPPAVNPELDEDHWTSKEDLAELVAREELREDVKDTIATNHARIDQAEAHQRAMSFLRKRRD